MTYRSGRACARRRTAVLCGTALATMTLGQAAFAQDEQAASGEGGIERIVVTAEFRQSTVEDTPIAITAVNSELLEARSQTNIYQVGAQAPNVVLKPAGNAQGGSALIAFIRGVGQTDFNYALEPGVGLYVDDVYYPTLTGALVELVDLDRVEILRGPQGTLAGKNSIGGAIKLFSRAPTADEEGQVSVTYGDFNRVEVRGTADFTVVPDKVWARVAGVSKTTDGYVDQYDYACLHPGTPLPTYKVGNGCKLGTQGGQALTGIRGSLRWDVTDKFELNFIADATNEDSEARAGVLIQADGVQPVPVFFDANKNGVYDAGIDVDHDCRFVAYGPHSCDTANVGKYATYATFLDPAVPVLLLPEQDPWKPLQVPQRTTYNDWGLSMTADWELSDKFSLKSITAWREYESEFPEDTDESPLGVVELLQRLEHSQFSQEIRLNGTVFDDALDFTVGGFYFDQDGTLEARVDLSYVALDFIHGPDTTPSTNQALFANATWHLTDRMNLSGGVRYSEDEKTYGYQRHNPDGTIPSAPCNGPPGFKGDPATNRPANPANCAVFGLNGISAKFQDERFDYRAVADYRFTDDLMAYVQYSTGYKGGGVNPRPFVPDQAQPFNPEELQTYEIGAKTSWFGRRLRLDGAVFYNEFTDIQLSFSNCPASAFPIPCAQPQNAGDAEVKGWELEAQLKPTDALSLDASVGAIDFEYTEVNPLSAVQLDYVPPYTPELVWSAGAQYEFDLGNAGSLTPRIDATHQSDVFTAPLNTVNNTIEGYTLLNGRLTWRAPDDTWKAALEVTNLTDEYYFLTLFDQPGIGYTSGQPGQPRTWAVTITRAF